MGPYRPAWALRGQRGALKTGMGRRWNPETSRGAGIGSPNSVGRQSHLKVSLGTPETEIMPPEAGVRPSDAGLSPEAGLGALKEQQRASEFNAGPQHGQCGLLNATEGPSKVSIGPLKTLLICLGGGVIALMPPP